MRRSLRLAAKLALLSALVGLLIGGCGRQPVGDAAPQDPPPPVEASTSVDRAVATTGDLLMYTLVVEHDPEIEVEIPEAGSEIAGFRIIELGREDSRGDPVESNGRITETRWYQLRADLVGSYVLPSVTVSWQRRDSDETGRVETSEIFVEVESVLPADGEATDIRGLKPLRRIESGPPWEWIAAGAGGALLLTILAFWWWYRRREETPEPAIPPHEVAFAALDELRGADFSDPEAVRRFAFRISEVMRTYVEGRFGLNATDLTTEEILPRLSDHRELTTSAAGDPDAARPPGAQLATFLRATDRVKFAGHSPTEPEIQTIYEDALSFVERTVPPPEPAAGEEHGATTETAADGAEEIAA
ncbi:MAG: hypothetical protein AAF481_09315 [Acidobacteriota bacterium]